MKKRWAIAGVVFIIICITLLIITFGKLIITIEGSISEVTFKQDKVKKDQIERVALNGEILNEEKSKRVISLLKKINFNPKQGKVKFNDNNYNNILEIITSDGEVIEFKFYFSKKCWNNTVMVKSGMMDAEAEQLCKELTDDSPNNN